MAFGDERSQSALTVNRVLPHMTPAMLLQCCKDALAFSPHVSRAGELPTACKIRGSDCA